MKKNIFEKYTVLFLISISLILFYFIFKDFLLANFMFFFKDIGSDTVNITLPNYVHSDILSSQGEGFFRFWSFYRGMGQANGMQLNYNPISIIAYISNSIFGVNFWYYRIYYILFLYVLPIGLFSYYYFKQLGYSNFVALIGGLLFEFSGYVLVGMQWGHSYEVLFFIFLLFSFEQYLQKKRWYFLTFAYILISSNPFLLAVTTVFMITYSLLRYYEYFDGKMKGYISLMFRYLAFASLGILINAPRFVFYFQNMLNSPRVKGDVSVSSGLLHHPENINSYLRNVTVILRSFANDLLGTGNNFIGWYNYLEAPAFYVGLISLLLFPICIFSIEKRKRLAYFLFLSFWLLVAFVPILRHTVNFFMGNYYKISIDVFVPFTFLFFATKMLNKIDKQETQNHLLLITNAGILLVLLHFPYFKSNALVVNFEMKLVITVLIVLFTALIYTYTSKKINKTFFYISMILLLIFELAYISYPTVNKRDKYLKSEIVNDIAGYRDGTINAVKYIKSIDSSLFFRIEKDYSSGNAEHTSLNDAMVQGYYGTTSYGSFNQLNYIEFLKAVKLIPRGNEGKTRWCNGVRGVPILMAFAGVKYFLTREENNNLLHLGYDSIAKVDDIIILKNNYALSLGFAYDKYITRDNFDLLSDFKKQEVLLNAIVLDAEDKNIKNMIQFDTNRLSEMDSFTLQSYANMIDTLRKNSFEIKTFNQMDISGKITMNKPGYLFFTIPYDKGWKIYVNGKKYQLKKVNIGFSGIYLNPGNYDIELKYRPLYFEFDVFASLFGILIFLLLIYFLNFKKKNNQVE